MIFIAEQALLKGREQFDQLLASVRQAVDDHQRVDTLEHSGGG